MEEVDILIKTIKELHQNTVFIEQDYNGYYVNTDEFFEKLKHTLEDRVKPKLEWEENPPSNPISWHEAIKYAESLNTMSEGGWRLPTKIELIYAYAKQIEGFQPAYYWSSSKHSQSNDSAWSVYFVYGYFDLYNKLYNLHVRCVREVK